VVASFRNDPSNEAVGPPGPLNPDPLLSPAPAEQPGTSARYFVRARIRSSTTPLRIQRTTSCSSGGDPASAKWCRCIRRPLRVRARRSYFPHASARRCRSPRRHDRHRRRPGPWSLRPRSDACGRPALRREHVAVGRRNETAPRPVTERSYSIIVQVSLDCKSQMGRGNARPGRRQRGYQVRTTRYGV
jgi:hypothetical protein